MSVITINTSSEGSDEAVLTHILVNLFYTHTQTMVQLYMCKTGLWQNIERQNIEKQRYRKDSHSQKDRKLVFKTNYRLMQVKSFTECAKWSILQYFRSSFSYHLSLRSDQILSIFEWPFYTGFTVVFGP